MGVLMSVSTAGMGTGKEKKIGSEDISLPVPAVFCKKKISNFAAKMQNFAS